MTKAKQIKSWILAALMAVSVGGNMLALAAPQTVAAADKCVDSFVGLPGWYRGLTNDKCDVKSPKDSKELTSFIWHIALNLLEAFFVILGYLTGIYFLYGGFLFIGSQGKPETAAKARLTMTYAVFGLVIAMTAVAMINFVVDKVLG